MAHLVYGPYILEYSKIQWCFGALFRMLVGDFDYSELSKANGTITPVVSVQHNLLYKYLCIVLTLINLFVCVNLLLPQFFTLYIGLVYIVMLNIFVAILNEAYTTARRRYEALDHPKPQGVSPVAYLCMIIFFHLTRILFLIAFCTVLALHSDMVQELVFIQNHSSKISFGISSI